MNTLKRQGPKWVGKERTIHVFDSFYDQRILLNLYLLPVFLGSSVNLQVYTDKSMESFEFGVISYFPVQVERGCFISGWK